MGMRNLGVIVRAVAVCNSPINDLVLVIEIENEEIVILSTMSGVSLLIK